MDLVGVDRKIDSRHYTRARTARTGHSSFRPSSKADSRLAFPASKGHSHQPLKVFRGIPMLCHLGGTSGFQQKSKIASQVLASQQNGGYARTFACQASLPRGPLAWHRLYFGSPAVRRKRAPKRANVPKLRLGPQPIRSRSPHARPSKLPQTCGTMTSCGF
jgi:hypothetical protein